MTNIINSGLGARMVSRPAITNSNHSNGSNGEVKSRTGDLNPVLARIMAPVPRIESIISDSISRNGHEDSVDKKDETPEIKFKHFSHGIPGKAKVYLRGMGDSSSAHLELDYNPDSIPDPLKIPRDQIKLNGINPRILKQARVMSRLILEEWKKAKILRAEIRELNKSYQEEIKKSIKSVKVEGERKKIRHEPTPEKSSLREELQSLKKIASQNPFFSLYNNQSKTSNETFTQVFNEKMSYLVSNSQVESSLLGDEGFKSLVAYLCIRKDKKNGFNCLPDGFFNYDDPDVLERVRTLGRYLVVDQLGLDRASKVEEFDVWSKAFSSSKLNGITSLVSVSELMKLLFPGYLDGGNPPIREWMISGTNKWQGENLDEDIVWSNAIRACKQVVLDQGVVNLSTGDIDFEKLEQVDWGTTFHDKKYGLRGAIGICDFLTGACDALELAIPGLFKVFPKYKLKYPNKWTGENGLKLIDEITKNIVEKKLKLLDDEGNLCREKVKAINDWARQFDEECTGCLKRSGVGNAYEALKRLYPQSFGWGEGQINPGEIRFSGMWDDKEGVKLFKLRFAKSIYDVFRQLKSQGVKGFIGSDVDFFPGFEPPIRLNRKDFITLKDYYYCKNIKWYEHMLAFNLTAGFSDVANSNTEKAFEILLGPVNAKTGCYGISKIKPEDVTALNAGETSLITELLCDLDDVYHGGDFSITGFKRSEKDPVGIVGTPFERYLEERPEYDVLECTNSLYQAFSISVLSSETKDDSSGSKTNDRNTALEKIIISEEFSNSRLKTFFRFIRDEVIDSTDLNKGVKERMKELISKLLKIKKSSDMRDVLLNAINSNRKYSHNNNACEIISQLVEKVLTVLAINEIWTLKIRQSHTSNFDRFLGHIKLKDEESVEEGSDTEEEITDDLLLWANTAEGDDLIPDEITKEILAEYDESVCQAIDSKELEGLRTETLRIFRGLISEQESVTKALVECSRDTRKKVDLILSGIEICNLSLVSYVLNQIQERSRGRAGDRYNYSSLRVRELPTHYIEEIIGNQENNILDLEKIDKDIFQCIPPWWPGSISKPKAIPVLYYNNVLEVMIPPDYDKAIEKQITDNLKDVEVEFKVLKSDQWLKLVGDFRKNANIRVFNEELPPLNQFILPKEEALLIKTIFDLRVAIKGTVK